MNKKVITIGVSVICIILLGFVCVGLLAQKGIIQQNNVLTKAFSQETEKPKEDQVLWVWLCKGAEATMQYVDPVLEDEYSDIYIKFNDLQVTKERGDFDIVEGWGDQEIIDEKGNIINDYSYVVANITMINKGKSVFEETLNNMRLIAEYNTDDLYEARSYNSEKNSSESKSYFLNELEPNKEYNFNMVYILPDEVLKNNANKEIYIDYNAQNSPMNLSPKIIEAN